MNLPGNLAFTFLFLFFPAILLAQETESPCPPPDNSKAVKLYEQGMNMRKYDKQERVEFLQKAYELEPEYSAVLFQLAEEIIKTARLDGKSYKPAKPFLEKLIEVCPDYNIYTYFYLGQIAYEEKDFKNAALYLEKFTVNVENIRRESDFDLAEELRLLAKEYDKIFGHPVPFDPVCIPGVNTEADEYLAVISPDDEFMFFTRRVLESTPYQAWASEAKRVEYFVKSTRQDQLLFDEGEKLPAPFNQGGSYGGATITPDNKHLFLTICLPQSGRINCDIYTANLVDGRWDSLRPLGEEVNTPDGWEGQPSVSSDGKTLYFSSSRADSRMMDLYKSERLPDGTWSQAENLGEPINTAGNEKSPFLHSDSQTLYFSSDGHTGMGGFDVFMSKAGEQKVWRKPVNLRYPINTPNDEVGFFVSTDGNHGYFATNTMEGKPCAGGYDLYSFELYKEARPEKVVFIRGEVEHENPEALAVTEVEVRNTGTQEVTRIDVDSIDGKYVAIVAAKNNEDFVVTVKEPGKAISSHIVTSEGKPSGEKTLITTTLKTIKAGETYQLNDIHFGTNSSQITARSLHVLDELVRFMKENPKMRIAVYGHTDDVGNDQDNLLLSTDRAFSVMEYLQSKGISKDRLAFKGYGETKPLVPNTTDANRALNRRTEFKVLQF